LNEKYSHYLAKRLRWQVPAPRRGRDRNGRSPATARDLSDNTTQEKSNNNNAPQSTQTMTTPSLPRLVLPLFLSSLLWTAPAGAEEVRLSATLQNDIFAGTDGGGYTNGIALAYLRTTAPDEAAIAPQWLLAPVAGWLGLGPATLALSSLNQVMVTPADITRKVPDPADAPYLGALWFRAAQVSVHGDIADTLAVNLGMIGPASGARQSQILIHRLTGSDRPQGWDYQVHNHALIGVDRYRAVRVPFGAANDAVPSGDLIALGGASLGNWQSSAGASLLLRYGTGLQRSYPTAMRQSMRTADPSVLGRGWFVYAGVHADRVFSQMGVGSNQPAQGSTAKLRETQVAAVAGIAYGWEDGSLSFSLQNASSLTTVTSRRKGYGSLTYTMRY
jgi:hypothetical protein